MANFKNWTHADEQKLFAIAKQIKNDDKKPISMAQLAKLFPGKSKNAIIGKLYRAGLNRISAKHKKIVKSTVKYHKTPKDLQFKLDESLFNQFNDKTVLTVNLANGFCRWPVGSLHSCGDEVKFKSYCQYHFNLAYDISHDKTVE